MSLLEAVLLKFLIEDNASNGVYELGKEKKEESGLMAAVFGRTLSGKDYEIREARNRKKTKSKTGRS